MYNVCEDRGLEKGLGEVGEEEGVFWFLFYKSLAPYSLVVIFSSTPIFADSLCDEQVRHGLFRGVLGPQLVCA